MGKVQEKIHAGWIIIATDYSKLPLVAQIRTTWIKRKGHDTGCKKLIISLGMIWPLIIEACFFCAI
jgi:hypothetical protein